MATITADTYLDDGTARTAGETWTINGGKLTIRTDSRWHANSPASMTGSLGASTISATLGGGVLIDGRDVRWLAITAGGGTPTIGDTISQGGVSGYYLGYWSSLTAAPSATIGGPGFIKLRSVTGGSFAAGALTFSGVGSGTASGADVAGWIEVVQDQSTTNTVSRKGTGHQVRGTWFYLDDTNGSIAQVLQVPTNGGGADTYCPGVWIETDVGSDVYEYWPELASASLNGWLVNHLGAPEGGTDRRQKFVKGIGSGQMQIGETLTQASTYAAITQAATYTWANDVITVSFATHGWSVGQQVYLDFTSGGGVDGLFTIESVTGTGTFTVAAAGAGASGNVTVEGKATITFTAHGLSVGQQVYLDATSGALTDGTYEVLSVTDANNYVVLVPQNAVGTGNVTARFTIGYIPPSGCKTRVPNVFLRQCTTGARASNARPHATIGSRPRFTTTGAGAIDHEYAYSDWYYNFGQPYSIRLYHTAAGYDAMGIAECATAIDMLDGGVSMNQSLDAVTLTLTSCFAGGTIDGWKFFRGNAPGANDHAVSVSLCAGQTFANCEAGIIQTPRSSGLSFNLSQSRNLILSGCRGINGGAVTMTTCSDVAITDFDHVDRFIGVTNAVSATYAFVATTKCADVSIDGVTYGYAGTVARVHPYAGLISITSCDRVTFRNAGTRATPLGDSSVLTNATGLVYVSGANNSDIRIQRVYLNSVRTGLMTDVNTDKGVLYESVSAPRLSSELDYTWVVAALNATVKGCKAPLSNVAANASVYGTHLFDTFTRWRRMLSTYTWASDLVTVSFTAHGLSVGDKVYLDFTSGGGTPDGVYTVKTVTSANVFVVALSGSGTAGNLVAYRALTTTPADLNVNEGRLHLPMNEETAETAAYVTKTGTAQFTSAPGLTLPASGDEVVIESQHTIKGHTAFPNIPITMTGAPAAQASTYTWAANVLTVTFTAHGYQVGDQVFLDATSGGLTDGLYTVAGITSANVYTIALTGSGTSGNATAYRLFRVRYKIDTGSGYNASWRNLFYRRAGGATTSGSATITMQDTTGVEVDDYIYGIGVGVDAKVQSVDSATQITATVNSVATGSNILLEFNHLPNETIDPAAGFDIKFSITPDTPHKASAITYLTIPTTTTAVAQDNLYPLDVVTVSVTARDADTNSAISGARVMLAASAGTTVTITRASSTATVSHTAHGYQTGDKVVISGAAEGQYNGLFAVTYIDDDSYSYTVTGTPTTPATGTITSYQVVLDGSTDVSGVLTDDFSYTNALAVTGRVRKGTSAPYYKTAPISGTITSSGLALTAYMVKDE